MRKLFQFGLIAIAVASSALAEGFKVPWPSPSAKLTQAIGITEISVNYHRPALKGRDLAQELKSAGKIVWRFGANEATQITFSDPVTFGGEELAAGEYGLFAIPEADEWTIIVSKQSKTWGAYAYDPKQDVTRIYVKPKKCESVEYLTFAIDPTSDHSAQLKFAWGTVALDIPVEVDVDGLMKKQIEEQIATLAATDWDTRLQIVKYWVNRKENLERALTLADEGVKIDKNWWTLEWKARTLDLLGRRKEGLPILEEALVASRGKTPIEYQKGLEKMIAEWR